MAEPGINKNTAPGSPALYYFIFILSGFSGLIYESVWSHYLKLFLGHAAYAQTLVLVIFMGGMAVGAWGTGKYSHRIRKLLLAYAIAEGVIGLFGIFFHEIFTGITGLSFITVIPALGNPGAIESYKWTLAALLILPQSILLGTTFPLMTGGIIRNFPGTPGKSIARLYFLNSIGASAGILFSGFFLIENVGLPGTILTAGIVNLFIAITVGSLSWGKQHIVPVDHQRTVIGTSQKSPGGTYIILLGVSGLTGLVSFMYEIGWIRMLSLVLGSSTHSFELMLSAFILGLALGSWYIKNKIERLKNILLTLGIVQIIMGILAIFTVPFYNGTFSIMSFAFRALDHTPEGYTLFNLFSHSIAMFIMLPATIYAGMTLPLVTYYLLRSGYGEKSIGQVYGINTVGAIAGVLIAVHLLMPLAGLKNLIIIAGTLDILTGLFIIRYFIPGYGRLRFYYIVILSALIVISIFLFAPFDAVKMASGVFRHGLLSVDKEIIFHKDGKTSTVDVFRVPSPNGENLIISTNGKPDASIGLGDAISDDETTQALIAAIPLAITEADSVAVIGFGSGKTSHILLHDPNIKHVDIIEIEPAMVEGAKYFREFNGNVFRDERCRIHIDDAKTFFTRNQRNYDLILSEPSNVWVSGVSSLFSEEFYGLVKEHLTPDGLLLQWMHLYESDMNILASIMKALSIHFEHYEMYFFDNADVAIIAKLNNPVPPLSRDIFKIQGMKEEMDRIGLISINDLQIRRIGSKRLLDPLFQSYTVPANSDYYPFVDLNAVKARFMQTNALELQDLTLVSAPLIETLEDKENTTEWSNLGENQNFIRGLKARQANNIFEYYQGLASNDPVVIESLSPDILLTIRNVNSIFYQSDVDELSKVWPESYTFLMQATIPYLSGRQMKLIFGYLETADALQDLPPEMGIKFELYKAVSARDYQGITELACELLPEDEIGPSPENDHYLMLAMMGHIALGQDEEARALWGRYRNKQDPPLKLRLLGSHLE